MSSIITTYFQSPLGLIEIRGDESSIFSVSFDRASNSFSETVPEIIADCKKQLEEYFAGARKDFELNVNPVGTFFQASVWNELKKIKYASTTSYLDVAKKLGDEKSVRAVGAANGKNPIAIIIPCHRVVGANNSLTGYAGGLWRKQWLLEHEARYGLGVLKLF
ncbi:MAG: methylated-DNA--[protein]-cysteine S-methyltransferase [Chitinophagales bacterium]